MKNWLQEKWQQFIDELHDIDGKHWKILGITGGVAVIILIVLLSVTPHLQQTIRTQQLASVVYPEKMAKKVTLVEYPNIKKISQQETATIIFVPTNGLYAHEVSDLLADDKNLQALNHTVYLYPMVYNTHEEAEKFAIDYRYTTVIFFEKGKEENRLVLKEPGQFQNFVAKLNDLSMENIKTLE
ncbi:hypothetical protein [Enterococcus timonensis]|uniref:hypothetical protein n=1 Tax=Enterococcus timonensis TaxID=1852364 RepID=UPI0008DA3FD2|nr:hypothetical protein [Enterococcus timonensis]